MDRNPVRRLCWQVWQNGDRVNNTQNISISGDAPSQQNAPSLTRRLRTLVGAGMLAAVTACATGPAPPPDQTPDPLEPVNRAVFDVAGVIDAVFLKPIANIYLEVLPEFVRTPIGNFLQNLEEPVNFVNNVFQLDFEQAGNTAARFGINSTVGIGGLFDPATGWGYPYKADDFGLTLARYGVGPGFYLYLPGYGPSTVRDGVGLGVDWVLEPINTLYSDKLETFVWIRRGADIVHSRAQVIGALDQIERTSVDLYASVRSLYLQSRASTIRDEATNVDDLPDIDLLDWESDS